MQQGRPLSERAFRRIVDNLSAQQLRELPQELLPESIPPDLLQSVSDRGKRAALEELIWDRTVDSVGRSVEAREALDSTVCRALERAESASDPGVVELEQAANSLLRRKRGTAFNEDWLEDPGAELKRARDLAEKLVHEAAGLAQAIAVLDRPFVGRDQFAERVSSARLKAKKVLSRIQASLGRFQMAEMELAHDDMKLRHWQCERNLSQLQDLDERIGIVREKLRRQEKFTARMFRPRTARHQREVLAERLHQLLRQRDELELPISEDELSHWLDVLTNANIMLSHGEWEAKAQRSRLLLYRLLNVFCLQQETAAQGLARNPFSGIDARVAIEYYLASEQFILSYFSKKRKDVTLWLAGAAENKLAALEDIRDAILADYRRTARTTKTTTAKAGGPTETESRQAG